MPGGDYGYGAGYGGPPRGFGGPGPEGYGGRGGERYGGFEPYGPPGGGRGGFDDPRGGFGGPGGYPGGGPGFGGVETAQSPLDAEIQVVIREIHQEITLFEQAGEYGEQYKNARRLLAAEADKLENSIDPEWLEVDILKPIKVTKKILIPNFRHPHFNFVGKVLGPKGAHLQALAKQFKCHIYVLGRGSTKDRAKEQELLNSGDAQYAHYGGPLHVKVETIAPAHVAYSRISGVLEHLSKTLVPVREGGDPTDSGIEGGMGDRQENGGGPAGRGGRGGSRGRGGPDRGGRGGGFRGGPRGMPRGGPRGGGFRPY